jgi:hypothetical protein
METNLKNVNRKHTKKYFGSAAPIGYPVLGKKSVLSRFPTPIAEKTDGQLCTSAFVPVRLYFPVTSVTMLPYCPAPLQ